MRRPLPMLLILLSLAAIAGCSRAPRTAEPVTESELAELIAKLNEKAPTGDGYRVTGDGEITVSGRTLKVAFAGVYDRPSRGVYVRVV